MDILNYQLKAMRTRGIYEDKIITAKAQQLLCGALGLSGEAGEFTDNIKKIFFHNKQISDDVLMKELGDCLWYAALICDSKGWSLSDICDLNIRKLEMRYENGFNFTDANKPRLE